MKEMKFQLAKSVQEFYNQFEFTNSENESILGGQKVMSYVDEVIESVVKKNPGEPEFHQAVKDEQKYQERPLLRPRAAEAGR